MMPAKNQRAYGSKKKYPMMELPKKKASKKTTKKAMPKKKR
jgi:hypothetical protein